MPESPLEAAQYPLLTADACLTINRCQLPARILGSVSFQHFPQPLLLDGVHELHRLFFAGLQAVAEPEMRALHFRDYMSAGFLLDHPERAGLNPAGHFSRPRADYLRVLRGWMFDSDSQEAAVLKGWAESRFGLLTRYHQGPLTAGDSEDYLVFQRQRARGLYNTNALEAQLDCLFAFCQYELQRRLAGVQHLTLYRGTNGWQQQEVLQQRSAQRFVLLLNNLNSFTSSRHYAEAFGDYLLEVQVPVSKLLYFPGLLPGVLPGEEEYLLIGGLYEVKRLAW